LRARGTRFAQGLGRAEWPEELKALCAVMYLKENAPAQYVEFLVGQPLFWEELARELFDNSKTANGAP
jgi:hypothetical protein